MSNEYPPQGQQPTYEVPPSQGGYSQGPSQGGYQPDSNQGGYSQPPGQQYGYAPQAPPTRESWGSAYKDKWVAAILAFMLGSFGVHKFYLGYKTEGLTMLLVSLVGGLCFGIGAVAMLVIGYIEAAKYLMLTQEDFERTYVYGSKGWL
jgi:TM2 domain-containing membrane protein YozV